MKNADTMIEPVRIVIATFKNKISLAELPFFRGSMIQLSSNHPLFHNHENNGFRYSYPLVQYKCIDGHAVMIGLNEGGIAIERLLEDRISFSCQLGNRFTELELIGVRSQKVKVECLSELQTYSLQSWLPLNSENYQGYLAADGLVERMLLLERILIGNILSFAKGIGVFFDEPICCRIQQIKQEKMFVYKNVEMVSFSAIFQSNVSLPDYIGLGKSVSLGNGIVIRIKDDRKR